MYRAVMLELEGKSYRLKEATARPALNTAEATDQQYERPARRNLDGHRWGELKWPPGIDGGTKP